ncbi:MAG: HPr family phosphocarrier protein [Gammaproteobacteria bacterium]|nr:HPr family phosphocarrier protein [Gammaproteobacteria bacterium]
MIEKELLIVNKLGLHARAASEFVKVAQRYSSVIELKKDNISANGKSIISMMMLQATIGTPVIIRCEGEDEEQAMEALAGTIANRFGEDE